MALFDISMALFDISMALFDISMALFDISMALFDISMSLFHISMSISMSINSCFFVLSIKFSIIYVLGFSAGSPLPWETMEKYSPW